MEEFDPDRWFVAGGCPLELVVDLSTSSPESRTWGDQADFEALLPHAWHARRSDDWSYFTPLVERVCRRPEFNRWDTPDARALYNALNHMLLYAGDGRHPIGILQRYMNDVQTDVFNGESAGFRECFEPLFGEMWQWWFVSGFAPHMRAGTEIESVDIDDQWPATPEVAKIAESDPLHLSGHCGAPLGQQWTDVDQQDICDTQFEVHDPRFFTIHAQSYRGWMTRLRNIEVTFPVLVKVSIAGPQGPVTLGFWVLVPMDERTDYACSRAIFIPDSAMLTTISVVQHAPGILLGNDAIGTPHSVPSSLPLGLFDGIEDVDLEGLLFGKQAIRDLLLSAVTQADDTFMVSINAEEDPVAYVQGVVEDERMLHVELSHEDLLECELSPDQRAVVQEFGWNPPEEDFPNYWLLLDREAWSNEAIADLLTNSLDRVYRVFDDIGEGLSIEIRPLSLAEKIAPDDFETTGVRMPGEKGWVEVGEDFPFDEEEPR